MEKKAEARCTVDGFAVVVVVVDAVVDIVVLVVVVDFVVVVEVTEIGLLVVVIPDCGSSNLQ